MRYCLSAVFFSLAGLFFIAAAASPNSPPAPNVLFSPRGGCTDGVVAALDAAENSAYVSSFVLSSDRIATALLRAKERGVTVEIVMDSGGSVVNGTDRDKFLNAKIPVFIDSKHRIMHNKIMIIDEKTILTGSFNWTDAAENNNAENLLFITDSALAKRYLDNFNLHKSHSSPIRLETPPAPPTATTTNPESPAACPNGTCNNDSRPLRPRRR